MKRLILLFCTLLPLFAIQDFLIKPPRHTLYRITNQLYPAELNETITQDENNTFLLLGHFRVIYGNSYKDSQLVQDLAQNIATIAQEVWQKEIEILGFMPPRNTDRYYIDIYIANKGAYNPFDGTVTIGSSWAGYATTYPDGTPYFVINPDMSLDILKVTIAHEFFHTVQYAYGVGAVSDDIWYKNIWFLEATATLMEDEVFGNVNDYVNYIEAYLDNLPLDLEYANGRIEYGKVLFGKYLKETLGIESIKMLFDAFQTDPKPFLNLLQEKIIDFDSLYMHYALCIAHIDSCFTEGTTYPQPITYRLSSSVTIGHYGIFLLHDPGVRYLNGVSGSYLQRSFNDTTLDVIDLEEGEAIINPNLPFHSDILRNNIEHSIPLHTGWNLIFNPYDEAIPLESIDARIIWIWRDGTYVAYSKTYKETLRRLGRYSETLYGGEGAWVLCDHESTIDMNASALVAPALQEGWNLLSFSAATLPHDLNVSFIYGYIDGNWSRYPLQEGMQELKILEPLRGYFMKK